MKPTFLHKAVLLACLTGATLAHAAPIAINQGDTIQTQIEAQKGKKVTLRLLGGEEITGVVKGTTKELIHLGEVAGREAFDAVVEINTIAAVLIRTK